MLKKNAKRLYDLSVLLILLLACSSINAQTVDRIEIQDTLNQTSFVYNTDFRPFISVQNSFTILVNDGFTNRLQFIKLNTANQVVNAVSYSTTQLLRPIVIQSATYYQGDIYFISTQQRGYIGKLDTDLNLVWLKRISSAETSRSTYFQKAICGLNNHIYIGGSSDSASVVSRYTLDGNFIDALEIRDHAAADSTGSFNGGNYQNLITDDTSLYLISEQRDGINTPAPVTIIKMTPNFYYPTRTTFFRSGFGTDDIVDFRLIENDQNMKIEFNINGSDQFFSIKMDRDLNILDQKSWRAVIGNSSFASPDYVRVQNGNDFYDIFPINGFGQSGFFFARSYLGWIKQNSFYVPNNGPQNVNSNYVGYTRHFGQYRFIRKQVTTGINGNASFDIVNTTFPPSSLPCSNTSQSFLNEFQQFTIYNQVSQINDRYINISLRNVNLIGRPISVNQYPLCGYNQIDTCNLITAKIQSIKDSICAGTKLPLSGLSYLGNQYTWKVNGQFYSNDKDVNILFPTQGTYWVDLEAVNANGPSCKASDRLRVSVIPAPLLLNTDTTLCKGDSISIRVVNVDDITWSSSGDILCDTCPATQVSTTNSTFVSYTASNRNICTVQAGFWFRTFPNATGILTAPEVICPGSDSLSIYLNTDSGNLVNWWVLGQGQLLNQSIDSATFNWGDSSGIDTVFVSFIDSNNCIGDTIKLAVEVSTELKPKILETNKELCDSDKDSLEYRIEMSLNKSRYFWSASGGNVTFQDSSNRSIVNWDTVGSSFLVAEEFIQTDVASCYGLDTLDISIYPNPSNDLNLIGLSEACASIQQSFLINQGWSSSTYQWNVTGNAFTSALNTFFFSNWLDSGDFSVTVYEKSSRGCIGSYDTLEVRVHPKPQTEISLEDSALCYSELDNQEYEADGFENSTYNWSVTGGEVRRDRGNSITVDWLPRGKKRLKVLEVSEFGCIGDTVIIPFTYDFSNPKIVSLERLPFDTTVLIIYDLEYHWMNPNITMHISRSNQNDKQKLDTLGLLISHLSTYLDRKAFPDNQSASYVINSTNRCDEAQSSLKHSTLFLQSSVSVINQQEEIELNWSPYENWESGLDRYEIYEVYDTSMFFNTSTNINNLTIEPILERRQHCFIIKAIDNSGEHETWSNVACTEKQGLINIPNVVTANNDGFNDYLEIFNLNSFSSYRLAVYNRWGRPVFESTDYKGTWPGDDIPQGTYFVSLSINDLGEKKEFNSWVEVLK